MFISSMRHSAPRGIQAMTLCISLGAFSLQCKPGSQHAETPLSQSQAAQPTLVPFQRPALLLSQAHFGRSIGPDGKAKTITLPAKLRWVSRQPDGQWHTETLEDDDSNVFHKALCRAKETLLTIGGTEAHLKRWRLDAATQAWSANSLWNPDFGGKFSRLRDIETADIDNDGHMDAVIATHDQGVIAHIPQLEEASRPGTPSAASILWQRPNTFVHEIELGDIDQDGVLEIFATPSKPNSSHGSQGGEILMLKRQGQGYKPQPILRFEHRHAKEILWHDNILWVSLEARATGIGAAAAELEPLEIRRYRYRAKKQDWQLLSQYPIPQGLQARVITPSLTHKHVYAVTTWKDGIHILTVDPKTNHIKAQQLDPTSGGFEHAAVFADLDQDGQDALYVSSEDLDTLTEYQGYLDPKTSQKRVIAPLGGTDITWSIDVCL